jgi:mannosyltransferase
MNAKRTSNETRCLWLILIVGALVRLYRLDSQSLWADEGLQYFIASAEGFDEVFGRLFRTFHPPLSYLIHHVFLGISDTDFFLRLPSALFGIASMPLVYVLARRLVSQPAAVLTLVVFSVSPFHTWYSQEGRMYAQLLFLSLLSTYCLTQALEKEKAYWWGGYILAVFAGMYTHVFMGLAVSAQCLWVFFYHRRHLSAYCISGVIVTVLCLPLIFQWGGFLLWSAENTLTGGEVPFEKRGGFSWFALPYTFFVYGAGFSLGPSVAELHEERSVQYLLQFFPVIILVGITYGVLLVLGIVSLGRQISARILGLCLLGLGMPLATVTILSVLTRFAFNPRYTIVAFPYFCLLVGVALAFLWQKKRWAGIVAVGVILGISTASLKNLFFNPYYAKEDVRSAVALWRMLAKDEPLIVFSPAGGTKDAVMYYLDISERNRMLPMGSRNLVENIKNVFPTHETVSAYVILVRDWKQVREKTIRNAFVVDDIRSFPGVRILRISVTRDPLAS